MDSLFGRLKNALGPRPQIGDAGWQQLLRRTGLARRLAADDQRRLRDLCERFLRAKAITAAAGLRLTDDRRLLISALCCVPVLRLGFDWLRGWDEVIVYPGQFRVRREQVDEATGVVDEFDDELAGESWDRGPLVLSWSDLRQDLHAVTAGCNVVAHEIAHKLDALDGVMDGTPPLPDARRRRAWVAAFQPAYEQLRDIVESGAEPAIDPYAAESPDEFFAVVSEYHFSAPDRLREVLPDVAAELEAFYGPSPFAAAG